MVFGIAECLCERSRKLLKTYSSLPDYFQLWGTKSVNIWDLVEKCLRNVKRKSYTILIGCAEGKLAIADNVGTKHIRLVGEDKRDFWNCRAISGRHFITIRTIILYI